MSQRYIEWMRELKERFYPWPSRKRVEKKNTPTEEGQKSVEGTAPRPRQDVFEDD